MSPCTRCLRIFNYKFKFYFSEMIILEQSINYTKKNQSLKKYNLKIYLRMKVKVSMLHASFHFESLKICNTRH